jgi:serine/threonine protein kinase
MKYDQMTELPMQDVKVLGEFSRIKSPIRFKNITYDKDTVIGEGSFATVHPGSGVLVEKGEDGQRRPRQVNLAVKILRKQSPSSEDQSLFVRELSCCVKAPNHPTILRLLSFSICPYSLVFERVLISLSKVLKDGATGRPYVHTKPDGTKVYWDDTKKAIVAFGIAVGMRCLRSVEILHRDLKSDNIMLNEDLHPRIGDFGLAKMMNKGAEAARKEYEMTMNLGTPLYMAPECYSEEEGHVAGAYNFAVDVYAYGMILYELVTNTHPWETPAGECPGRFQLKKFLQDGQRPQIPS